ncbi:MAG: sigma 54-interacting transcriptional regulator [Myxococcota bacterium]
MDVSEETLEAARVMLRNPFEVDPARRHKAAARLAALDVDAALGTLTHRTRHEDADRLALAWTLQQMESVAGKPAAPPVLKHLKPRRVMHVRIAAAAVRCHRQLLTLQGQSATMGRLREEVWGACFGPSLEVTERLERVIRDHDVLIQGETGTGKETVASAVLAAIPGPGLDAAPQGTVNAAALPETLVESELFGHIRGAFTGATRDRPGRIRGADGGGFFLDEVGDLPMTTQSKLLRLIEADEVVPVGSDVSHRVDVRFVAATHHDLPRMVERGTFRRDLYERIAGCIIRVPALRERPEDIVPIGMQFVSRWLGEGLQEKQGEQILSWLHSDETRQHPWPGNVRELNNALRNMMLGLPPWPTRSLGPLPTSGGTAVPVEILQGRATLAQVQDWYTRRVMDGCGGNHAQAARTLGVDRSTLRRRARRRPQSLPASG